MPQVTTAKKKEAGAVAASAPSSLGLRKVRLFEAVPADGLEEIAKVCRWRRSPAGQRIISRDAADTDVYFVIAGCVKVTAYSASGREVSYGERGAGEWFGDFAAIDGLLRSADVVSIEDTLVASMSPDAFKRVLHEHPSVCDVMLRRLVGCVRELTDRVFDFSTLGVQNRLHAELLRLARGAGPRGNTARIDPAPKHSDIASQISTYREQVTRELSTMAKQGLVQRDGRALVIPDIEQLEQLVRDVRR